MELHNDPFESAARVESREALVAHALALRSDLAERGHEWENTSLADFLEALAAWLQDMDGYFADRGEVTPMEPTWALLAQMLCAAAVYE